MFGHMRMPHNFHEYSGQIIHQGPAHPYWNQEYRQHPFPYQSQPYYHSWNTHSQHGAYFQQGIPPYTQSYHQGYGIQNSSYPAQSSYPNKETQFLFHNPLQPKDETQNPYMPMNGHMVMNPYPKHNIIPKQNGGMQSLMNSFKSQDGSIDFNKMMNTAGQMMNAVTQVSSLVKGLGGIFKV